MILFYSQTAHRRPYQTDTLFCRRLDLILHCKRTQFTARTLLARAYQCNSSGRNRVIKMYRRSDLRRCVCGGEGGHLQPSSTVDCNCGRIHKTKQLRAVKAMKRRERRISRSTQSSNMQLLQRCSRSERRYME